MRREKVAVLTQGTLTDAEMLAGQPEAAYLMALAELPVPGMCTCAGGLNCQRSGGGGGAALPARLAAACPNLCPAAPVPADALMAASEHTGAPPTVWIGACACDAATGQLLLGQWLDDEMRSQVGGRRDGGWAAWADAAAVRCAGPAAARGWAGQLAPDTPPAPARACHAASCARC